MWEVINAAIFRSMSRVRIVVERRMLRNGGYVIIMRRIFSIVIIFLALFAHSGSTLAFSRDELVRNARIGSSITTSANIVTNVIHLGGSQIVGNSASNGTAMQTIQDAINRLNQLRNSLRLR